MPSAYTKLVYCEKGEKHDIMIAEALMFTVINFQCFYLLKFHKITYKDDVFYFFPFIVLLPFHMPPIISGIFLVQTSCRTWTMEFFV